VYLGTCIAPVGTAKEGDPCVTITFQGQIETVPFGSIRVFPLGYRGGAHAESTRMVAGHAVMSSNEPERKEVTIQPARGFDVGHGRGRERKVTVTGGMVGLIIDARGRPLSLPNDPSARIRKLREWLTAMGIPTGK